MHVFVKTLTGKTIPIEVEPADTVERMKEKIAAKEGIPSSHQRLILEGVVMDPHSTVASNSIQNKTIVHLVLKLGGAPDMRFAGMEGIFRAMRPPPNSVGVSRSGEIKVCFKRGGWSTNPDYSTLDKCFLRRTPNVASNADWGRYNAPKHFVHWSAEFVPRSIHVVELSDPRLRAQVNGKLEYHCTRNNGSYYGGDDRSWQFYTQRRPIPCYYKVCDDHTTIAIRPKKPLRPLYWHAVVLQNFGSHRGPISDLVLPFCTGCGDGDLADMFTCPLTLEPLRCPVTTRRGSSFEKAALQEWRKTSELDPLTGKPIVGVFDDLELAAALQRWKELRGAKQQAK